MIYDICLHVGAGGPWLGNFYLHIKKELERKGLSVVLYTTNNEVKDVFVANEETGYIFLDEYTGEVDTDWALKFVGSLGFHNPKSLYVSEQKFYDLSESECIKYFSRLVHSVELLKDKPAAKFYITYEGDEFDHSIFRILCRMNKGRQIYWGISNLDLRIHFHDAETRYSQTPMEPIDVIPEEQLDWIRDYIKKYTSNQTNLWGDPKKHDVRFELFYIGAAWRKFVKYVKSEETDPRRYLGHSIFMYFRRILRRQYAYTKYADEESLNDISNCYYFPMHVPYDSQLTQRGLPFYDQVSLIETITQYLPYPSKLIVKEHPMGRGLYSIRDMRKLSKLPNVILLPAYANSHNIVPKVKGIFVINSSVGYEGLLYGKPVVTFGRSFYREQGLTIDINSLYELEDVFRKIDTHNIDATSVEKFIYRVWKNTYPVDLYNVDENYFEKANVFIDAIEQETIKRM
ncbi:hypothetical protein [Daejeonella sp.]|uniref:capsular polysaccharide export protein, LipB/KpsS family n=1 Tax=Daejeonella sp. TaxID=2805397 RepID=UPI0030BA3CB9